MVLLEDFISTVPVINRTTDDREWYFDEVSYYNSSNITAAYRNAA